ncbi:mandelate racemase/muconate lactonizing enzyme family protein [Jiella sonneratiae]|uniref:Mandelate racemase/muconate lactonizing enzyme family protein n=1 Tax=Jiella sonneratiae TaxID=2816856 RepID=A0ABS3J574_9HYPH|nr:mandelate racemase/muconate lactonizing enzyme family protein [Jiella sonneratiae]MBO0904830.1 mandelate racemase/muconate lactonizing enzyme family protein [Jiella sonneratiae]
MHLSLHRAMLTYGGGLTLHTASSGPVSGLDTLYLRLRDGDGIEAVGEVRINIAYLNGLSPDAVLAETQAVLAGLDLSPDPLSLLAEPPPALAEATSPVRMLVDMALHDRAARQRGLPLAGLLGLAPGEAVAYPTNQTLFVSDDRTFLAQAEAYVSRGFTDLKVRIGAGELADDLRRIALLRQRFASDIKIAADANGAWNVDAALRHLERLAPFDLAYVEQPAAPAPLAELARLAEASPVPIMLDESIGSEAAAMALATAGHRLMAHLKLVKLGGIAATMRAARALEAQGVPIMIGQMNEGGLATAAVLHASAALKPRFAELYGADGILADPAEGLSYARGMVAAPARPGLGLAFRAERTRTLWEN